MEITITIPELLADWEHYQTTGLHLLAMGFLGSRIGP
jgi:hypothetical protein